MTQGGSLWVATTEIVIGTDVDNPILNVYTISCLEEVAFASSLISSHIIDNWLPVIRPIIWDGAYFAKLTVNNQFNLDDFNVVFFGVNDQRGTGVGDPLPPFNSAGILFQRSSRDVRNGYKRYSPVLETQQSGGVWNGGMITALQTIGEELLTPIDLGVGNDAFLSIVKRRKITDIETGKVSYELPTSESFYTWYTILDVEIKAKVGTQDTRKR